MATTGNLKSRRHDDNRLLPMDGCVFGLTASTHVYLAGGIPSVFRRVTADATQEFENPWLYVPRSLLRDLEQVEDGVPPIGLGDGLSGESGDADEPRRLLPVFDRGRIKGVIACREADRSGVGDGSVTRVQEAIAARDTSFLPDVATQFTTRLFDRDQSHDRFLKSLLELMAEQWPRTLGGVYFNNDGIYRLRFAVGDIGACDRLAGSLPLGMADRWEDAVRRKEFLVPADIMPEYPVLMNRPPKFAFVHPGIVSRRTEYLVALILSGDVDEPTMAAIGEIARLASHLDETQFSSASELSDLYGHLDQARQKKDSVHRVLGEALQTLYRQLEVSRIVLTGGDGSSHSAVRQNGEKPSLRSDLKSPIPAAVLSAKSKDDCIFNEDIQSLFKHGDEARQYFLDNVCSEIIMPVQLGLSEMGSLAVGSPVKGDYLLRKKDFLAGVAQFVGLYASINEYLSPRERSRKKSGGEGRIEPVLERFDTIHKLAGGYFHDLLGLLSVVVGQSDIIRSAVAVDNVEGVKHSVLEGSRRVNEAADRMASFLGFLRDLCTIEKAGLKRKMSGSKLIEDLPAILHGYTRQLRDTKNISIAVKSCSAEGTDFYVTYADLYDSILPLVLSIMDNAERSGVLTVDAVDDGSRSGLRLTFNRALLGAIKPSAMLRSVFAYYLDVDTVSSPSEIHVGDVSISWEEKSNELCRIVVTSETAANVGGDV